MFNHMAAGLNDTPGEGLTVIWEAEVNFGVSSCAV
jgi:hypothetical protein